MSILGSRPQLPEVKPSTPLPDEEKIKMAKRKDITKRRQRTGRTSTILSDEGLG